MTRPYLIAALALTACACAPVAGAPSDTPASITYSTGPCFGTCPVYSVEVRSDGSGVFTGERFTAVTGERRFSVTTQQFQAFASTLAAHRPEGTLEISHGHPRCGAAVTDMSSVRVTWRDDSGPDELYFYYGCRDDANRPLAAALGDAAEMLPIQEMIGPHERL